MSSLDLTASIVPRSDQLNAEDLLTGPCTVTISEVRKGTAEQPFDFHLAEFPGRPFRPSKTVRRIFVHAWGPDAATYAGRRMVLYRNPKVRFGGQEVGGIRVSALSHIDKPFTLALTETRGKRETHTIQPLPDTPERPSKGTATGIPDGLMRALHASLRDANLSDRAAGLAYISDLLGREIGSTKELSKADASFVIDSLKREAEVAAEPTLPEGGAA